jgi:hypothetical protein
MVCGCGDNYAVKSRFSGFSSALSISFRAMSSHLELYRRFQARPFSFPQDNSERPNSIIISSGIQVRSITARLLTKQFGYGITLGICGALEFLVITSDPCLGRIACTTACSQSGMLSIGLFEPESGCGGRNLVRGEGPRPHAQRDRSGSRTRTAHPTSLD